MRTYYAIALGSNQRHPYFGSPHHILKAAFRALDEKPLRLIGRARTISSRPIGPSQRTYANSAALISTKLSPSNLLAHLKSIERHFGRRKRGQCWRARVLDLDIILWSGGLWFDKALSIPHLHFRHRSFVLTPLMDIARDQRDPISGFSVSHLKARLDRKHRPA